jgi:hypothetical protein
MPAALRFLLVVSSLLALSARARAQSQPTAGSGNGQAQLALVDAVSLGAATTGYFTGRAGLAPASGVMWAAGGVGYFIGGPLVHLGNQEYGLAGASATMRLVFPLIGAAIAGKMATCTVEESRCGLEEAAQGFAVGAATAALADNALTALLNATEKQPERVGRASRPSNPIRVLPSLVAAPNVAMFGVGGRF